ncbi:MAG: biotin transporter BioY [Chlamydiales bacterium]
MQALTYPRVTGRDFILVLLASFVICLFGSISIPLWFTPIPIGTQNSVCLLMGALLGARRGAAAVFAFLMQGAMGLPVFAGGAAGCLHLMGPRGGYLIGYLIAAFVVGTIVERRRTLASAALALAAGNGIIYLAGAGYLALFVGGAKALTLGIVPFLAGDLLKMVVTLKILKGSWS